MDIMELILGAITLILGAVSIVFAVKWQKAKRVVKEIAEALTCTASAIEDDTIDKQEAQAVVEHWKDVIDAACDIVRG